MFECDIFNAGAIYYMNTPITTLLENQRNDKKKTYNSAVQMGRRTSKPFITSCDAILDIEAEYYLKRLSSYLSEKWEKSYSEGIGWVRARIQVCILRSVSLCLRGSRTKWISAMPNLKSVEFCSNSVYQFPCLEESIL